MTRWSENVPAKACMQVCKDSENMPLAPSNGWADAYKYPFSDIDSVGLEL